MAPLYDFDCPVCHHRFETLIRKSEEFEEVQCPKCGGRELQMRISVPGTYQIKGDNSASTRPRKSRSNQ